MINENFVFLGAFLSLIGGFSYLIDTIKGKVKPNRVTWFLWALAPMIAFVAELKQDVDIHQSLLTFIAGLNPILIFIASFVNKKSQWKITKVDLLCGGLSMIGISLWLITQIGNIAIFFSILADALAATPTIIKSYKYPETENYIIYFFGGINAIITLLTIVHWNFANYGFPLYILLICLTMIMLIKFRLGKKISTKP